MGPTADNDAPSGLDKDPSVTDASKPTGVETNADDQRPQDLSGAQQKELQSSPQQDPQQQLEQVSPQQQQQQQQQQEPPAKSKKEMEAEEAKRKMNEKRKEGKEKLKQNDFGSRRKNARRKKRPEVWRRLSEQP